GAIRLYDLDSGKPWSDCQAPQGTYVGRPEFAADGRRLLAASIDGTVLVWDLANPRAPAVTVLGEPGGQARFAVFFPDGRTVATGDDRMIRVWDLGGTGPAPSTPAAAPPGADGGGGLAVALAVSLGVGLAVRRRGGGSRADEPVRASP